jgi:hypothetical protein
MAGPVFTNNAVGALAGSYSAGATAITLVAGQGAKFPSPGAGDWFPLTIVNPANAIEIMRCTARTADTFTVARGQEGTAAMALGAGDKVEHRLTAGAIIAIRDRPLIPSQIPNGFITAEMIGLQQIQGPHYALGSVTGPVIVAGAVNASHLAAGAALGNLGFTPVQQGGGIDQTDVKLKIGWSITAQKLKLDVDGGDKGNILTERSDGSINSAGYRGLPQSVQNNDYVFGLGDAGRQVLHYTGNHTYFVPTDAAMPALIGTVIKVVNREGFVTFVPAGGVTLTWVPSGATGARVLSAPGTCVLEKMDGFNWWIYGPGLS